MIPSNSISGPFRDLIGIRRTATECRLLRSFLAVADTGRVGRAAITLHLSQPPLTRRIHQREAALGVTLFVRTAKGMALTDAGASFVDEARNLLTLAEQARERGLRRSR